MKFVSYDPIGPKANWMYLLLVLLGVLGIVAVVLCVGYGIPSREFWQR